MSIHDLNSRGPYVKIPLAPQTRSPHKRFHRVGSIVLAPYLVLTIILSGHRIRLFDRSSDVDTRVSASFGRRIRYLLHVFANLLKELIGNIEAEQAYSRVLDVQRDVDNQHGDDREPKNVQPTPPSAASYSIASQKGTQQPQAEQKSVNNYWGMNL